MAAAGGLDRVREFRFRLLQKPEEFRSAEELERLAMGGGEETPVSVSVLRTVQDHGGLVCGAFADIYLAAVGADLLGWDGSELYRYCLLTAVRPEYQNHRLGYRLMAFRREEALKQGLAALRWSFDPLRSRAARLSLHLLGARVERYLPHYFGRLGWGEEEGVDTDRLRLRWGLADPSTEDRIAGKLPSAEEDRARWAAARAIITTEESELGLRVPTEVSEPSGPAAQLEIPFDLTALRQHDPGSLRRWRSAVRDAFRAATDLGYEVQDFVVLPVEHERRSFYLLGKATSAPPAPPSAGRP
jgi:predicted GNAT superfamily acetyltransferase